MRLVELKREEVREMCRVNMGHLRVTIGHLRVTIGHLRVTVGHLRVSVNDYLRAILGQV